MKRKSKEHVHAVDLISMMLCYIMTNEGGDQRMKLSSFVNMHVDVGGAANVMYRQNSSC